MSLTYLVGYANGDASDAAVRFAIRLATPAHAEVIAAHVLVEQLGPRHWADAHARAEELLSELGAGVTQRRVVEGPTAHGLHDLAIEVEAALLIVGATHRGSFGRMVPGSVGERLIHAAPCPLAIVPANAEDPGSDPLATVGVAFDGREPSRTALGLACEVAQQQGARLVLMAVEEWPSDLDVLAGATELIPPGLSVEHRLLTGPAGPALVAGCADGIDLLVVGSRGYGPLHTVLAGGVARHLVDHAPCPVLVVPRGDRSKRGPRVVATTAAVAA
jgi:nucleotide-binding universal stress UspA family protein